MIWKKLKLENNSLISGYFINEKVNNPSEYSNVSTKYLIDRGYTHYITMEEFTALPKEE